MCLRSADRPQCVCSCGTDRTGGKVLYCGGLRDSGPCLRDHRPADWPARPLRSASDGVAGRAARGDRIYRYRTRGRVQRGTLPVTDRAYTPDPGASVADWMPAAWRPALWRAQASHLSIRWAGIRLWLMRLSLKICKTYWIAVRNHGEDA